MVMVVNAAPSGEIHFPDGQVDSVDNILEVGNSEKVVITFRNTASDIDDVASTLQFITLSAANLNPSRALIDLDASWEIFVPGSPTPRTNGTVTDLLDPDATYAPYSPPKIYIYTWALGKPGGPDDLEYFTNADQFHADLKILRPGELLNLTVTIECQDIVGDDRIWFFFKATEFDPTSPPIVDIDTIPENERINLYYSKSPGPIQTAYWWPLHNSYDPYDSDIETGHVFRQVSWTRVSTTNAFAKANKLVHQKPEENPRPTPTPTPTLTPTLTPTPTPIPTPTPQPLSFSFHICGLKFDDYSMDGIFDVGVEQGIDGVVVTLLGSDMKTLAEEYYTEIEYPLPEGNPLETGENQLRGSYCFNIINVLPGKTYTFYVEIEEIPLDRLATTPTLIGPIELVASPDGPRESINNHVGNVISPVGGVVLPINKGDNKLMLLPFWLSLLCFIGVVIALLVLLKIHRS